MKTPRHEISTSHAQMTIDDAIEYLTNCGLSVTCDRTYSVRKPTVFRFAKNKYGFIISDLENSEKIVMHLDKADDATKAASGAYLLLQYIYANSGLLAKAHEVMSRGDGNAA